LAEDAARVANGILARNTSPLLKPMAKRDDSKGGAKMEKKPVSLMSLVKKGPLLASLVRFFGIYKRRNRNQC